MEAYSIKSGTLSLSHSLVVLFGRKIIAMYKERQLAHL